MTKPKSKPAPPAVPDEPYSTIRVALGGTYVITWGLGWWPRRGVAYRRSARRAIALRDRKLKAMERLAERTRLARLAVGEHVG